jgi:hypothetical protein
MVLAGFSITKERSAVLDYTFPFYEEEEIIIYHHQGGGGWRIIILAPFTIDVWLSIISGVIGKSKSCTD